MRGEINGLGVKNICLSANYLWNSGEESKTKILSEVSDGVMFDATAHLARKNSSEDERSTGAIVFYKQASYHPSALNKNIS